MYGKIFERIEESMGSIGTYDYLGVGFCSTWLSWIVAMGEGVGGLWDLSCIGRKIFCKRSIRGEIGKYIDFEGDGVPARELLLKRCTAVGEFVANPPIRSAIDVKSIILKTDPKGFSICSFQGKTSFEGLCYIYFN